MKNELTDEQILSGVNCDNQCSQCINAYLERDSGHTYHQNCIIKLAKALKEYAERIKL